jgi:Ca-activated chloride channel homolog
MIFRALNWFHGLWLLPLLIILLVIASRRRSRTLFDFSRSVIVEGSLARRGLKSALRVLALGAVIFALSQPAWDPQPTTVQRRGRDIVFLIDVSRSMLAEDLAPNRLERAKIVVRDVLNVFGDHRVGLVAFAGSSVVKCPLTFDHNFMRLALDDLTTDSITRGGSLIGDAIRKALTQVFVDKDKTGGQDIILISDGDDQESFPLEAAKQARERGVRIIALGLGDDKTGQPIPIVAANGQRRYLRYQGRQVTTQLIPKTLRQVSRASLEGRYLHVATGHINLDEIYARLIENEEMRELDSKDVIEYQDKFQIFLLIALVFCFMEGIIHER